MSEMKCKLLDYIFSLVNSIKKLVIKFHDRLSAKQQREFDLNVIGGSVLLSETTSNLILSVVFMST